MSTQTRLREVILIAILVAIAVIVIVWALWRTPRIAHVPSSAPIPTATTGTEDDAPLPPTDPRVADVARRLPRCTGVDTKGHTISVWDLPYPDSVGCKVRFWKSVESCRVTMIENRGVHLSAEHGATSLVIEGVLILPQARPRDVYRYECKEISP